MWPFTKASQPSPDNPHAPKEDISAYLYHQIEQAFHGTHPLQQFAGQLATEESSMADAPVPQPTVEPTKRSFISALKGDAKKVWGFISGPKAQALARIGETVVEDEFPAATGVINILNIGAMEAFKAEALAQAAGAGEGSNEQKAAMVLNALTPEILSFAKAQGNPVPHAADIQRVNDNIVEVIQILSGVKTIAPVPLPKVA